MQDLVNNNWIILDPLGNIYEIYANVAVMTLLNCNYNYTRWVIYKSHICKSKFHVCYHFVR